MKLNKQVKSSLALLSLTAGGSLSAQTEPPRGADVGILAANCNIGSFPQTSKAGDYNVLCDVMEDAEKCLALLKGQFIHTGEILALDSSQKEKAQYCLDVLKRDLGLEAQEE